MGQDNGRLSVKEVEHPVVDSCVFGSKLVYPVSQIVRLRSSQFMAELRKTLDSNEAPVLSPPWQLVEPRQKRDFPSSSQKMTTVVRGNVISLDLAILLNIVKQIWHQCTRPLWPSDLLP